MRWSLSPERTGAVLSSVARPTAEATVLAATTLVQNRCGPFTATPTGELSPMR